MMNTASSPLDPYHTSVPHNGDPNYATLPMQPFYVDSYAPHPAARGAIMDQMPMSDGLAPLAPVTAGAQQTAVADLQPHSFVENGRKYELKVVQQPQRARMCGFGDKDRRPITPPPCVHLIITDVVSGKEVDCNEIDHGMFVLNVDLWNEAGTQEVNLIRNSQASPSISSTSMAAYTDVAQTAAAYTNNANALRSDPSAPPFKFDPSTNQGSPFQTQAQASYSPYPGPPPANTYSQSPSQPSYGEVPYQQGFSQSQMMNTAGFPQNGYPAGVPIYYTAGAGIHTQVPGVQQGMDYGLVSQPLMGTPSGINPYDNIPYQANDQEPQRMQMSQSHPGGMFTRNLIGSLAASAFRLTDPNDRIGIWFVLQDLSVRTEGTFRLRFSFVNVGAPGGPSTPTADPNSMYIPSGLINTGRAHVLASCFSDSFIVYSAKRFPGVVESTDLSKCFATQGIKIPIRKDGPGGKGGKDREEYEED